MSQPKTNTKHAKHEQSDSFSSFTTSDQKQYFNRSSMNNVHALSNGSKTADGKSIISGKKSGKMGALKKWFSRFGHGDETGEEKAHSEIEKIIAKESKLESTTMAMLLLGAGGSGKTTVFKQMDKLYNGDIDEKQLELAREDIYRNILVDIYDLSKYNIKLNSSDTDDDYRLSTHELIDICHRISTWPNHFILEDPYKKLTTSLAVEIDKLWKDKAMKLTWDKRRNSHIMDNTPYFFDKIIDIVVEQRQNYLPTFDDFVRVRDQTTGIIVKDFLAQTEFGEYKFSVTDVGGQRSERRKWMRLFDNIFVVVYIMSLSAYDQHLYEDNTKNCWDETLELFSKTSHESVFDTTDWVIFFNKVDIFEKKILSIPFTVYQPNFNELHKNNSQKVKEYIRDQFIVRFYDGLTKYRKKKKGNIYFHITCAT
eukprot:980375_1